MKQILPFVLIGVIVLAVVLFIEDDYESPIEADAMDEITIDDWTIVFFVRDFSTNQPEVGFRLEYKDDNLPPENITDIEIFAESQLSELYFQSLEMEDFNGIVTFSEPCDYCSELSSESLEATGVFHWRGEEGIQTEELRFEIDGLEQKNH